MKTFRPHGSGTKINPTATITTLDELFSKHLKPFIESTDFISFDLEKSKTTPNQQVLSVVRQSIGGKTFKQVVGFLVGLDKEEIEIINKIRK